MLLFTLRKWWRRVAILLVSGGPARGSAELSRSFKVLERGRSTPKTGLESIGIGLCRFVGTAPGILGLVSSGFGAEFGSKSTMFGRLFLLSGPF